MRTYTGHYVMGVNSVLHKEKLISTSLNSSFESFLAMLDYADYNTFSIPTGLVHRPDLISTAYYGSPNFDWLIMMFNNIRDPFQELNAGDVILIPYL